MTSSEPTAEPTEGPSAGPGIGSTKEPPTGLFGRLRQVGPGIIVSGSIVGSGELIVTTTLGAKAGFALLWLILFSCFLAILPQWQG